MDGSEKLGTWPKDALIGGAARLGIDLEPIQVEAFGIYLLEIRRWSARMNLTGLRRPEEIVRDGFLDALTCLPLLPSHARSAVDIGAGAGFPSIPLKIVRSHLALTLVDSARRKATFLRHMVRRLALTEVRVVQERAEQLAGQPAEAAAYDVAFARAVAAPEEQVRLALPFLRPGGVFIAQVGGEPTRLEAGERSLWDVVEVVDRLSRPPEGGRPGRRLLVLRRRA